MPCDTTLTRNQTEAQRRVEIDAALETLEKALGAQAVEVVIGSDGAVCFKGWGDERRSMTDVCAYLTLASRGSWELRQAVARAETLSGRSVNRDAVVAGRHSHDGGGTWSVD